MSRSLLNWKSLCLSAVLFGAALLAGTAQAEAPHRSADLPSLPRLSADEAEEAWEILADPDMQESFPRLSLKQVEVLAPATETYNCIAHSLDVHDDWVNPLTGTEHAPLAPMDRMYAKIGYVRVETLDYTITPGLEKVVVYATLNVDGTIHQVTHAAKQASDGSWTSKLGACPLIRHVTPEALRGPSYGTPVAVYVRVAETY